uniref:Glycosyl transferase group 1 n=1 Tax=Geobacter sp. (strain M21) TaxID=443144 RepID=C6E7H5_GEOSM
MPKTLLIEGWRFVPHSYACVNMWQCLELIKRPDVELYHRDLPYFKPEWKPTQHLFDPAATAALKAIPPLPPGKKADLLLRVAFPYRFDRNNAGRHLVFGTAEHGIVTPSMVEGGVPLAQAMADSEALIITPSNWSRAGFLRSGVAPERVALVPHGVDPGIFRPLPEAEREALRRQLGWQDNFVVLNVGCMTGNKGVRYLLKACAVLQERFPQLKLCMKGLDPLYPSRRLLQEAGDLLTAEEGTRLASSLVYIGEDLSFSDMVSLYNAADAYVSPYIAEGFNLPVLEAAACGLPVICTAGGPTDDFVDASFAKRIDSTLIQKDGLLGVQPDLEHLVELIAQTVQDHEFRQKARGAGPSFVAGSFTWRHAVEKLLTLPQSD